MKRKINPKLITPPIIYGVYSSNVLSIVLKAFIATYVLAKGSSAYIDDVAMLDIPFFDIFGNFNLTIYFTLEFFELIKKIIAIPPPANSNIGI